MLIKLGVLTFVPTLGALTLWQWRPWDRVRSPDDVTALRDAYERATQGKSRASRSTYSDGLFAIADRLERFPADRESALRFVCEGLEDSVFSATLWSALLYSLVWSDDETRLRELLACIPIDVDGPDGWLIEFTLTTEYLDRTPDGILVLFDAYDLAKDDQVRASLAEAVRRAFREHAKPEWNDPELMTKCRKVFQAERAQVKVNPEYAGEYPSALSNVTNRIGAPLFIPKDGPDSVKARNTP